MKSVKKAFKSILLISLAAILTFAMAACSPASPSKDAAPASGTNTTPASGSDKDASGDAPGEVKELGTIRLARVGTGTGAIDAAVLNGAFEKAGIKVEFTTFTNGTDAVAALVGGSLDLFLGSYEHVLRQRENGLDVKAFGLFNNVQGYKVVVKSGAPYQKLEDLKGQVLGVTKVGALSDTTLRKILLEVGIDPTKDVEIINTGAGSTAVAALDTGSVAAAMIGGTEVLEESGNYRVLVNPDFETAGLVLMGSSKWAKEHEALLKAFFKVISEERAKIEADVDGYVKLFRDNKRLEGYSDTAARKSVLEGLEHAPADMIVTKAAADDVVETQLQLGAIKKAIPLEEGFDSSYLPK